MVNFQIYDKLFGRIKKKRYLCGKFSIYCNMANGNEQLVEELKALVAQDDVMAVKEQVEQLKTQFYREYHQQLEAAREAAVQAAAEANEGAEDAAEEAAWTPEPDPVELQFRELLNEYKQKKAEVAAKNEAQMQENLQPGVRRYDYSRTEGDFHAENIRIGGGHIVFDFVSPLGNIADVELGVPVSINIDNGIAAMALAQLAGATETEIRQAMTSFAGVDRRFDFALKTDRHVLLSDYAHHPEEIRQSILSVREVFTGRKITGVFQPHLFTRTRDFYKEFADSLSLLDEVILTEIYPAREKPIEGVSSRLIFDNLRSGMPKQLIEKKDLPELARQRDFDVLMVLGAGDVVDFMPQLKAAMESK